MIEIYEILFYILAYIGLFLLSFYILSYDWKKSNEKSNYSEMFVSIIIPAHNEESEIARTIKSALSLDYPKDKLEIIVVDNASMDNTYDVAKSFEKNGVRVFREKRKGKGYALNLGISKARGEIIVSMDADTFVRPDALKYMLERFYKKDVVAVTASGGIYKPKTIWQRIQHIEYYLTIFLRKAFASVNSLYITAGAFSAYRKSFFEKYGGYDEKNITEDLEIALRIQSLDYIIENAPNAVFYTVAPASFKELLYQRRRWYVGLIRNIFNYRKRLFGIKKGALGTLILPSVVISTLLSIILIVYFMIRTLKNISNELISLNAINFDFYNYFEFNFYILSRLFNTFFSYPIFLIALFFIAMVFFYLYYAKKKMRYRESLKFNIILFFAFYFLLFAFWWIVSFFYILFNRNVGWGDDKYVSKS